MGLCPTPCKPFEKGLTENFYFLVKKPKVLCKVERKYRNTKASTIKVPDGKVGHFCYMYFMKLFAKVGAFIHNNNKRGEDGDNKRYIENNDCDDIVSFMGIIPA